MDARLERMLLKLGVRVTFFDTIPMGAFPSFHDPTRDISAYFSSLTLIVNVEDLPYSSVNRIPDVFTPFRTAVEGTRKLGRPTLDMPATFKPFPGPGAQKPTVTSYGAAFDNKTAEDLIPYLLKPLESAYGPSCDAARPRDPRSAFPYSGGETSALARLQTYFHEIAPDGKSPPVARYKVRFPHQRWTNEG